MKQLVAFFSVFLLVPVVNYTVAQVNPTVSIPQFHSDNGFRVGATNILPGYIINSQYSPNDGLQAGKLSSANNLALKTVSATLFLTLDLGDNYVVNPSDGDFSISVSLNNNIVGTKTITITKDAPEQTISIDMMQYIDNGLLLSTVPFIMTVVSGPDLTTLPSGSFIHNYAENSLRVSARIERNYAIDVRDAVSQLVTSPLLSTTPVITGKRANFSWNTVGNYNYPNYELQILRLYNTDPTKTTDQTTISFNIDWSKALKIETQSYKKTLDLTIMEGTGYYVWRVRPLGTFYEGGIANQENFGNWSTAIADGYTQELNSSIALSDPKFFYYTDTEENLNWMYSRVFTEGDREGNGVRVSEGVTYADPLMRMRQTQAYNSEDKTVLTSQTIPDYSGRPSLSTLPVPISATQGLPGYKSELVQNLTGSLYTAKDFDVDNIFNNPSKIKDDGTAFKYYNGNQVDGVGSTEGYSFSRTIFKPDGTGRVRESSGIGKVHALGERTSTSGRTTLMFYSSPSDEELVRVFGDEAPLAESVIKTVTVDPNDVVGVIYTSKEGKTIASAMISNETENLLPINTSGASNEFEVTNSTGQSVLDGQAYQSTKRLAIWEDKEVKISYTALDPASCVSCNLVVNFYLIDLDNDKVYLSDANGNSGIGNVVEPFKLTSADFVAGNLQFPSSWSWVSEEGDFVPTNLAITGSNYNTFTLTRGEYLIVKRVFSSNPEDFIETQVQDIAGATEAILTAIADKMILVTNEETHAVFETFMNDLTVLLSAAIRDENAIKTLLGLPPSATIPADFQLSYSSNAGNEMGEITLSNSSSCAGCPDMKIPVPKPDVCAICEATEAEGFSFDGINSIREAASPADLAIGGSSWNQIYNLVLNGGSSTEGDGFISYLLSNELVQAAGSDAQLLLNEVAPGFTFKSLAYMITNMLVSKYYTGQTIIYNDEPYVAQEDEGGKLRFVSATGELTSDFTLGTKVADLELDFNYSSCKQLYSCWIQAVDLLKLFDFEDDINVMDEYNDRSEGGSSEDEYDDEENQEDAEDKGAFQGLLDFIISLKMRKFNNSDEGTLSNAQLEALVSFPNVFLNCAGNSFYGIIDDNTDSNKDFPDYFLDPLNTIGDDLGIPDLISLNEIAYIDIPDFEIKAPILIEVSSEIPQPFMLDCSTCNPALGETEILAYPYILKPEWMFKYFVYNAFGFNGSTTAIDDANRFVVTQMDVELSTCYSNPYATCTNSGLKPCAGTPCYYTHESWSSAQRLNFYQNIRGADKCPAQSCDPLDVDNLNDAVALTKEKLLELANAEVQEAEHICLSRYNEFKTTILTELSKSCYEVVDCITTTSPLWEVSEANVNDMTQKVVDACVSNVNQVRIHIDPTTYATSLGYGPDPNSELPYSVIVGCNWINSSGYCKSKTTLDIQYFAACDQKILDQANFWTFELKLPIAPGIDPINCPSYGTKEWSPPSGVEDPNCSSLMNYPATGTTVTNPPQLITQD